MPPRSPVRGVEFVEFVGQPAGCRTVSPRSFTPWASPLRPGTGPRRSRCSGRAASTSWSTPRRRASPIPPSSFTAPRPMRSGSRSTMRARRFERAKALGAEPFEQPVGPGELKIPAIRGVGGGLIYFIDDKTELGRVWDIEFEAARRTAAAPRDAGLDAHRPRRPDHALRRDAELAPVLHVDLRAFQDAAGRHRGPGRPRAQPGGRKRRRRACASPSTAPRTAGRWPATSSPKASAPASSTWPSPPTTSLATAAALKANGFAPLHIPRNYYDDVEARFGLDPQFADRLREENILYDRDGGGGVFPVLQPQFRGGLLLRDRRAPRRLSRLRRAQCALPHRRAEAPSAAQGHAECSEHDEGKAGPGHRSWSERTEEENDSPAGLCHGPSRRAFAFADAARLLAEALWHRRQLRAARHSAGRARRLLRRASTRPAGSAAT